MPESTNLFNWEKENTDKHNVVAEKIELMEGRQENCQKEKKRFRSKHELEVL